jgi:hypothetical protein
LVVFLGASVRLSSVHELFPPDFFPLNPSFDGCFAATHLALKGTSKTGIDEYSTRALARILKAIRFSWQMPPMLHRFDGEDECCCRPAGVSATTLAKAIIRSHP